MSNLKSAKAHLEEVLLEAGFVREVTNQTVTSLTKEGFNIGGHYLGANYIKDKGLSVWSKSRRAVVKEFTISELSKLESNLSKAFEEIVDELSE